MKKSLKALMLCLCAVLLVVASIMGTLAYLTSTADVTNTFTVGKVAITLDETEVDTDGIPTGSTTRVKQNTYKLLPGHSYTKDPVIHVDSNSEDCWLFVKVENSIENIEKTKTVAEQMADNEWTLVSGTTNVYSYKEAVGAGNDIAVFGNFAIKGEVGNEDLAGYENKTIVVTAYAVQADGFSNAVDAWNAVDFN